MRIVECVQGDAAWVRARLGVPTASNFDRLITAKTWKPSAQSHGYLCQLLAEWLTGEAGDGFDTAFVERGREMEPRARAWYAFERDVDVRQVGFCLADDGSCGCSPDGLVGDDGGLEVKCFDARNHVGALLGQPPDEYRAQVQGCLLATGRAWWERVFFNPVMPPVVERIEPDEGFLSALGDALAEFGAKLAAGKARLRERGCVPWDERRAAEEAESKARGEEEDRRIFGPAEIAAEEEAPEDHAAPLHDEDQDFGTERF